MTQLTAMHRRRRALDRARGMVLSVVLATALVSALAGPALGEDGRPIRFGARTDVPPMAYEDSEGVLRGYSIDICDEVRKVFAELFPERRIEDGYVRVTAGDRQQKIISGEVDTVCGAFSVTESRLKDFDYSFLTFTGGAGVVALRKVETLLPRATKAPVDETMKVAVVNETTTKELVESLLGTSVSIQLKTTHQDAFRALVQREVDLYFGDREILQAMVERSGNADEFVVGGKFLTYEPYALPFAKGKNVELRHAANKAIGRLYRSKQILSIFKRHFDGKEPNEALLSLYRLYAIPE